MKKYIIFLIVFIIMNGVSGTYALNKTLQKKCGISITNLISKKISILKSMEKIDKNNVNWEKQLNIVKDINTKLQNITCIPDYSLGVKQKLENISVRNSNDLIPKIKEIINKSTFKTPNINYYNTYMESKVIPLSKITNGKNVSITLDNSWLIQYTKTRVFMEEIIIETTFYKKGNSWKVKVNDFYFDTIPAE